MPVAGGSRRGGQDGVGQGSLPFVRPGQRVIRPEPSSHQLGGPGQRPAPRPPRRQARERGGRRAALRSAGRAPWRGRSEHRAQGGGCNALRDAARARRQLRRAL